MRFRAKNYQRQGIATAMYDFAQEQLGKPIYPATTSQLKPGEAFWKDRVKKPNPYPEQWRDRADKIATRWASISLNMEMLLRQYVKQYGADDPRTLHAKKEVNDAKEKFKAWNKAANQSD